MTLSLILVNKLEFAAAKSGGYIYGYAQYGTAKASVYIDLGQEREYIRSKNDDFRTSYKLFVNSTVYYAKTDEDLDNSRYSAVLKGRTVKLFC